MKNKYSILVALILATVLMASAEPVTISGKVTDKAGDPLAGVAITIKGSSSGTVTDLNGNYKITADSPQGVLVFSFKGYASAEEKINGRRVINVKLGEQSAGLPGSVVSGSGMKKDLKSESYEAPSARAADNPVQSFQRHIDRFNSEGYASINESTYKNSKINPLSTFSIDVDNASYSNIRRFINLGELPPPDAVRIEEMINYFRYDYPEAKDGNPFSVYTELAECPWNRSHWLLHVGLHGKSIDKSSLPASNLVFLIDVSGSMNAPAKLPLLKSAFGLLVSELRPGDHVAIVVYAGAARVVLKSTPGNRKETIMGAIDDLHAGGSTAGGAGLELAYDEAERNFVRGGNNRIILATDGDFNVGESSNGAMERLVQEKHKEGIFITVLGFGMGNIKDDKMEIIADKGNGNYAYIDNLQEARRVLVREFEGTLFTIAKDVKFQIEFNPAKIESYRLIGYENRILAPEDFNDDRKDAGEMGAGHNVTALYELVPSGSDESSPAVDPLKYQLSCEAESVKDDFSDEFLTIKVRYKIPDGLKSMLMVKPVTGSVNSIKRASDNLRFAAAVTEFGMILRNSEFTGNATLTSAATLARSARGEDEDGYRSELIRLIETVNDMKALTEKE